MTELASLPVFDRALLRLILAIDQHLPGFMDAYLGPEALRQAARQSGPRAVDQLRANLAWLQDHLPAENVGRRQYLVALLRAIEGTLQGVAGVRLPYPEEVHQLYDIRPVPFPEERLAAAHRELDTLLPGTGPLGVRLEARRRRYHLAPGQLPALLELARDETRRRTLALVPLPPEESVVLQLTSQQPWGAYNWYQGQGRSLIEFNTDIPVSALNLIGTFAHEGYPGHHTEAVLKEALFWRRARFAEMAAVMLHSPAAVISEGIATTAVELIFPEGAHFDWTVDVLLPAAGIQTDETAAEMRRISRALDALRYVSGNAALQFHAGRLDEAETRAYLQQVGLQSPARAAKSFAFITHPLYRSYVFTYTAGYDLISAAAGADKWPLVSRLLQEQILPSSLAKEGNRTDGRRL